MGSYDGGEVCDICGLFLLSQLVQANLNVSFGSYKDDGLASTTASARQVEKIKKPICQIYQSFGLQVTIEANKKTVQFLDAELCLEKGTYKPFLKPGDKPAYVHALSNHPPGILKNIPESINRRLSALSSNEEVFLEVVPPYQDALNKSGYNYQLRYNPQPPKEHQGKRGRRRKVIWWNPPFSNNVKTKVGALFFKALDKNFPKDNPLSKLINRNRVKMSYRTAPNFRSIISSHNKKLIQDRPVDPPCNCYRSKDPCPLGGQCLKKNIIYQATVTPEVGDVQTYIGMTSTTFKERLYNHTKSFNHEKYSTETKLSSYIWDQKRKDGNFKYSINWRIIDRARPFNPVTGVCSLCTLEKFYIVCKPHLGSLNRNNEMYKPCPHREQYLLDNT